MRMRSTLAQALLASALAATLYARGLASSPPHLTHDEIKFAFQAKSIADTGRDINGRYMPLYFIEPGFSVGRDPICIYVMAVALRALPLSETSIRLSSALVGALGVGLTFVLGSLLFRRASLAWIAAGVLALTPTYFIHSRLALSVLYPVPFTVMWLVALLLYVSRSGSRYAIACGLVLGTGIYSYLAAAIMMPLYLAVTLGVFLARRDGRAVAAAVASFAVMLLPLAWWHVIEPDRYANILTAYRLYDPQQLTPAEKLRELLSIGSLTVRLETFWDAFSPGRLFFTGESSLQISTRRAGSFLLPVAVLLGAGLGHLLRERTLSSGLLVFGLVSAPIPAVMMADVEIRRWLGVVPFVAVVAAYGVDRFLRAGGWRRAIGVTLLLLLPLQFAAFARDFFGPYRARSTEWFGGNIRGAIEAVLDDVQTGAPSVVYISSDIPWVDAYWRFYTMARGQQWLLERTQYVRLASGELPAARSSDVLIAPFNATTAIEHAGWVPRHVIRDFDGTPSLTVARAGQ